MTYATEDSLGYRRIRAVPDGNDGLVFDETYRTAHLPLIDPGHPAAISASPDGTYRLGRYDSPRHSLVLPVPQRLLEDSPVFRRIEDDVRRGALGSKVAWDVMARRAPLLHATLSAGLDIADAGRLIRAARVHAAAHGGLQFRVGGPLLGQKNRGRIYFPVFPAMAGDRNCFNALQGALGLPLTDVFLLGYYSLKDELDAKEAKALSGILGRYGGSVLAEASCNALWLLSTNDDLVLSGRIAARIALHEKGEEGE